MKPPEYLQYHTDTAIFSLIVGYLLSPLLSGIVVPRECNKARKRNENTKIGRCEIKLSLFMVDNCPCRKSNSKDSINKLLELTSECKKVMNTRLTYKISIILLCISNKQLKVKFNKIPLIIASNNMKYKD